MIIKFYFLLNKLFLFFFKSLFDLKKNDQNLFLNQHQSLELLLASNKSLIRWGDGESKIILGGDLYFQKNSTKLFKDFLCLTKYYNRSSNYVLALPVDFLDKSKKELLKINKYNTWLMSRYVYKMFFSKKNVVFLDSFLFRENSELLNTKIQMLWEKENYVFFVHNNYKYYVDFCQKFRDKKVFFIEATSANSYSKSKQNMKEISEIIEMYTIDKNDLCVLVCSGPSAKPMVYNMSKKGIKALDMGHYFDYKFYEISRIK
jgi:hypothetical protein